jgi:hypothetical protein
MIQFACDSCGSIKKPDEDWILGLAGDTIGVTTARREVSILSSWSDAHAINRLAVHFCSEKCKDRYMAKVFSKGSSV